MYNIWEYEKWQILHRIKIKSIFLYFFIVNSDSKSEQSNS